MSDTWIQLIPFDREFVPPVESQGRAVEILRKIAPEADKVEVIVEEEIQFIDCGGNWMGVACPVCGVDAEPWFADAMSRAYLHRFHDLTTITPCCGTTVSLDKLNFGWPVGFARFILQAMNPGLEAAQIPPHNQAELEHTLGCQLHTIWRHI